MKIKKRFFTRKFLRKGNGEILGFAMIAPILVFFVCVVASAAHIGITNQNLSFAAYNCGRAAAVCETQSTGVARAKSMYEKTINTENASKHGYVPCEIELLDGKGWEKGSYIRCTVRYHIDTLMPFTSGVREQSIIMMIENGDLQR